MIETRTDMPAGRIYPAATARRLAAIAVALIATALPAAAQPPQPVTDTGAEQSPMVIAVDINIRRSRSYERQDTAGIAALYTGNATYVELMPILQVFNGRDPIKSHLDELIGVSASGLVPTVTTAKRNSDGTIFVAGDYLVLAQEHTDRGHFVQNLRWEDGAWRIAMHVFARPDSLTPEETYPHD